MLELFLMWPRGHVPTPLTKRGKNRLEKKKGRKEEKKKKKEEEEEEEEE